MDINKAEMSLMFNIIDALRYANPKAEIKAGHPHYCGSNKTIYSNVNFKELNIPQSFVVNQHGGICIDSDTFPQYTPGLSDEELSLWRTKYTINQGPFEGDEILAVTKHEENDFRAELSQ